MNEDNIYTPEFIPYYLLESKEHKLSKIDSLVYGFIRFFTKQKEFYFTSKRMSEMFDVSEGSIDNSIMTLKNKGLIETKVTRYKNEYGLVKSSRVVKLGSHEMMRSESAKTGPKTSCTDEIKDNTPPPHNIIATSHINNKNSINTNNIDTNTINTNTIDINNNSIYAREKVKKVKEEIKIIKNLDKENFFIYMDNRIVRKLFEIVEQENFKQSIDNESFKILYEYIIKKSEEIYLFYKGDDLKLYLELESILNRLPTKDGIKNFKSFFLNWIKKIEIKIPKEEKKVIKDLNEQEILKLKNDSRLAKILLKIINLENVKINIDQNKFFILYDYIISLSNKNKLIFVDGLNSDGSDKKNTDKLFILLEKMFNNYSEENKFTYNLENSFLSFIENSQK